MRYRQEPLAADPSIMGSESFVEYLLRDAEGQAPSCGEGHRLRA